ncbi:MAG: cytochrome c [Acetobacteraceae bacterium]|nr:cytochrome c [Acetobacteraceae bacterium]MDW8398756.1 cytochrome c [Acetobacteraceae bacterium]
MRVRLPLILAAGAAALFGAAAPVLAQDAARVIAERREGLRAVQTEMEAMVAIARAGGDPRPAAERIARVQAFFQTFPDRFPPGTDSGDTRALPAVWQNRAGFLEAYAALGPRLAELRTAAETGTPAVFAAAVQATGGACSNCHRQFRAR